MPKLTSNTYGKSNVRLTKVVRTGDLHTLYEFNVQILLEGAFEPTYTKGDNSSCIPTDTMKNTVYALAKKHAFTAPEAFAILLASHFITSFDHVSAATVSVEQMQWQRIPLNGKPHDHAFSKASNALRLATARHERGKKLVVTGGIKNLEVIKTAHSGFVGYIKDQFTTLKETTDRIFGTTVEAIWAYSYFDTNYDADFEAACKAILETFATHDSLGVQQTIYAMGETVLAKVPSIAQISFTLPNQHRIPMNLEPFKMTNDNDIFITTSEPFGLIKGTISRD